MENTYLTATTQHQSRENTIQGFEPPIQTQPYQAGRYSPARSVILGVYKTLRRAQNDNIDAEMVEITTGRK